MYIFRRILDLIGYIMLLLIIVVSVVLVIVIPVGNDRLALKIAKNIENIPLPDKTEFIEKTSMVGRLSRYSVDIEYFGAILIKSDLNINELDKYYSQYRKNDWSYLVSSQKSTEIKSIERAYIRFKYLEKTIDFEGYYIVYSWGYIDTNTLIGNFLKFDLRGG